MGTAVISAYRVQQMQVDTHVLVLILLYWMTIRETVSVSCHKLKAFGIDYLIMMQSLHLF